MPIRNIQFAKDEFYHIVKRGVEERKIFLDDEDRLRFINSLLVFNDDSPAPWNVRAFWEQRDPASLTNYKPKNSLVEIHAFTLMDNHFHLLLKQIKEKGVSIFMNKLGGYSYYFNKKYRRVGPLFQGRFKAILIKTDEQLENTFIYVSTNPIGIIETNWKEIGIKNPQKASKFLEEYKWSSYLDYLSKRNFPSVINMNFFLGLFGGAEGCKAKIDSWINYKAEIIKFKLRDIVLE
ncbi:MAG: hypothetical protein CEN87_291 [Parcubacteria group bacterium Licking1014_1]|nr:MAG: hypothetical protein CEN87_291 [Parcubacteria group bacterium Licking1014_1]